MGTSPISTQLEEALRILRERGVLSRTKSFEFGTRFALEQSREMDYPAVSRYAGALLAHPLEDADVPPLPAPVLGAARRSWEEKNPKEKLDDFGFRLGYYVEMLHLTASFWEERVERVLGEETG
ncbi:MAG: hypothetical protein HY558_01645 [Euryarchaeota archaeon]|nr:hypothetical protein [Euryarchaeota archaeon]